MTTSRVRELSAESYQKGDYTGWFENLYAEAAGNLDAIPWADRGMNYWLSDWILSWRGSANESTGISCRLRIRR
jgi:hypothetical protein